MKERRACEGVMKRGACEGVMKRGDVGKGTFPKRLQSLAFICITTTGTRCINPQLQLERCRFD